MINLLRTNNKFVDLVHLVLTITWYTFNSWFYQETDGVAMVRYVSCVFILILRDSSYTIK